MEFPSQLELVLRLALAILLGGLIGLERELADHPAGVRTHIALALGACLFGIVSSYGFAPFDASRSVTNFQVDPTRVASNIVTGVGFLGGGVILKEGGRVRGLTTAASLWVTAAIGLACALGAYGVGLFTTTAVLVSLVGLRFPVRWLERRLVRAKDTAIIRLTPGSEPSGVLGALTEIEGVSIRSLTIRERARECVIQADLEVRRGGEIEALLAPLAEREDVVGLDLT